MLTDTQISKKYLYQASHILDEGLAECERYYMSKRVYAPFQRQIQEVKEVDPRDILELSLNVLIGFKKPRKFEAIINELLIFIENARYHKSNYSHGSKNEHAGYLTWHKRYPQSKASWLLKRFQRYAKVKITGFSEANGCFEKAIRYLYKPPVAKIEPSPYDKYQIYYRGNSLIYDDYNEKISVFIK
jgi:hypothetical protein